MDYRFTIALIYDFDGTLAPGNMQSTTSLPAVGKSNKEFWTEANTLAEEGCRHGTDLYGTHVTGN